MQKRIVLVLAILFIASVAMFAQDGATTTTSDDLFAGVDGSALTTEEMNTVIGEGPQNAILFSWQYGLAGAITGAGTGAMAGAAGGTIVLPGIGTAAGAVAVGAAMGVAGGLLGAASGIIVGLLTPDSDPELMALKAQNTSLQIQLYGLTGEIYGGTWGDCGAGR